MNFNIKKLTALSGVSLLAFLSTFQATTKVDASLSEPASWDYAYKYNDGYEGFLAYGDGSPEYSTIHYTRTTDGAYYNYSYTGTGGTTQGRWPFEITMTFNRSNTNWYDLGGTYYEPAGTNIGSNNTVGSISDKIILSFNNQTSNNYRLVVDYSSTQTQSTFLNIFYDVIYSYAGGLLFTTSLRSFYIPAFTQLDLKINTTSAQSLFDAWYLEDLGVSDAYNAGYETGETDGYDSGYADGLGNNPNILLNGFQAMVGILVNFFLLILNLEVFNVSIMSVFSILALFVGLIWFLKMVRG
jgi:hypothetical protein